MQPALVAPSPTPHRSQAPPRSAACRTDQHPDCPYGTFDVPPCLCVCHAKATPPVTYACICGYATADLVGDGTFHLVIEHGLTFAKATQTRSATLHRQEVAK